MKIETFLEFVTSNPWWACALAFLWPLLVACRKALIRRVDRAWDEAPQGLAPEARTLHAVHRVARETKLPISLIEPMVRKKTSIPPPPK